VNIDIDRIRIEANNLLDPARKSILGQFMTPSAVAQFMASLFNNWDLPKIKLLDPGAGIGSLSAAFLEQWFCKNNKAKTCELYAYEIESILEPYLIKTLKAYELNANKQGLELTTDIINKDFIYDSVINLIADRGSRFTHAILNPPYKKISSDSQHRFLLRKIRIETVNLYSAFLSLVIDLMDNEGEIVAIIPRSFTNGLYYLPFRQHLIEKTAIKHIHIFESRSKAFKDDDVLQENIIIHLGKNTSQEDVEISISTDQTFSDYRSHNVPFEHIIKPGDDHKFIHIPTDFEKNEFSPMNNLSNSLKELGIEISTGPVVDFRVKEYLIKLPEKNTVPLLYPGHFVNGLTQWPKDNFKKYNAIILHDETRKWLYPCSGYFVVTKRFSAKEEKKRVVATVCASNTFKKAAYIGFENHLNVFHHQQQGLSKNLAYGLMVFLNSTLVDDCFRQFNGHTQINATDLRLIKYPSKQTLISLGKWAIKQTDLSQEIIDRKMKDVL